ncbi:hypothetical protein LTR10_002343 [Elasticomyces elasticus]|nr:hypothetical protein LTR10_002343 [Elasticomyces elasticus]KAK4973588.1 hypothetical protein LTR42_005577 [Elasticomyces elasticus]
MFTSPAYTSFQEAVIPPPSPPKSYNPQDPRRPSVASRRGQRPSVLQTGHHSGSNTISTVQEPHDISQDVDELLPPPSVDSWGEPIARVLRTTNPDDGVQGASPAYVPRSIQEDVDELFFPPAPLSVDSWGQPLVARVIDEGGLRSLHNFSGSSVGSEETAKSSRFAKRLEEAAPELVDDWKAVNKGKDDMLDSLFARIEKLEAEKEKARRGMYKPLPKSEKLEELGRPRYEGAGEEEWDEMEMRPHVKGTSPGKVERTADEQLLEMQVKIRLLPAIGLLSRQKGKAPSWPSASSDDDLRTAKKALRYVQSALTLVRRATGGKTPASRALMGLCHFYMGVCRFAESLITGEECSAERWFVAASVDAAGVYPEAKWAEQWIEASQNLNDDAAGSPVSGRPASVLGSLWSLSRRNTWGPRPDTARSVKFSPLIRTPRSGSAWSPTADEVPGSAGSSIGFVWDVIRRTTGSEDGWKQPPVGFLRQHNGHSPTYRDRPLSPGEECVEKPPPAKTGAESGSTSDYGMLGRALGVVVRTFRSSDANEAVDPDSTLPTAHSPMQQPKQYFVTNPDLSSEGSDPSSRAVPQRAISFEHAVSPLGTPQLSTVKVSGHVKRRSIAFMEAIADSLPFATINPSKAKSAPPSAQVSPTSLSMDSATLIAKRMGRRLSSIATGWEPKRADPVGMAEEGQSPYRPTFKAVVEGEEGWEFRRRKKSAEEMV